MENNNMSWNIDYSHSAVEFSARHLMIARVRGQFEKFTGEVHLDENAPQNTTVAVKVETASINTLDANRDGHLRSADFFESDKYPYMTFESRRVEVLDENHACLSGDLTIRDTVHPVNLEVEFNGTARSPWGTESAGFSARTRINRKDWGLNWNKALEAGGVLVGDDIDINIELELVKQMEAVPA
jgi:polyisoprenoid-binding protein YceI